MRAPRERERPTERERDEEENTLISASEVSAAPCQPEGCARCAQDVARSHSQESQRSCALTCH